MATEGRRSRSAGPNPRFAVVYRWKLRAGGEERFAAAWGAVTAILRERCGALGSRLHRADDGTHLAYAQWPSREAWKAADPEGGDVLALRDAMAEEVLERYPPMPLEIVADLLR
ncbi:MAG: antibiotic biosynthesis monooxygenase [Planctomycetota bacterium]